MSHYTCLEPQWPLFLKVNPPKTRPFPIKTRGPIWVLGGYDGDETSLILRVSQLEMKPLENMENSTQVKCEMFLHVNWLHEISQKNRPLSIYYTNFGVMSLEKIGIDSSGLQIWPSIKAAKPWFHQYLDQARYHLWRIVAEHVFGWQIWNLVLGHPFWLVMSRLGRIFPHFLPFFPLPPPADLQTMGPGEAIHWSSSSLYGCPSSQAVAN